MDQSPDQLGAEPSEQHSPPPTADDFAIIEAIESEDAAVVVAVTDESVESGGLDESALAQMIESGRGELDATLAELQQELAGMARTGIPGVDAALDELAALDPSDLQGSSQLLADVLAKLESVMSQTPQE